MLNDKGSAPQGAGGATKPFIMGSQGASHSMGLGFSIDLTKLKATPGEAQDGSAADGNDY